MNEKQTLGSNTAKNGFKNEVDIVGNLIIGKMILMLKHG